MGPGDRIELRGLRLLGAHGVLDEERTRAQPFEVDLDLTADLAPAGRTDELARTVDYGALCAAVAAEVEHGPHADLLERLAERVARAALDVAATADSVRVTVRKLRPPVPHDLASAAVTISRRRDAS